jgi:tetratricopeptide (TPR) repeat protein
MNQHPIMLTILVGLVVCSSATSHAAATATDTSPTPSLAPTTASSLDADTVYSLLTAELAGQNNQLDISFSNYLQQAKKTKDPVIAERATHIAQQMRDSARIMSAAQVWVELAPTNPEPRTILIQQLSKANRYNEIAPHIDAILKSNADADLQAIAMGAEELTPDNLHTLIKVLTTASEKYPQNISLHLTVARLLMVDKQWDAATKQLTNVLDKDSKQEQALLLQSEVLLAQRKSGDAVKLISGAIKRGADSKRMQVYYARLLLEDKQTAAAKKQFQYVTELYPDDSDVLFTLALLSLDSDLQDLSQNYFQKLIDIGAHESEAHYYLGQISENENHPDAALAHYSKIDPSTDVYLAGVANSALILLKQGKGNEAITRIEQSRNLNPDLGIDLYLIESDVLLKQNRAQDAVTLLTKALTQYKNQPDLLYARSLAAEKANNLALVEKDLRFLIKQDPNNVSALNALGYTLASRTNRLQEALQFITKALALRPNDPAIIDSMGWVQFRLGNYQQSLELLRRAYKSFPDEEVASHLIEVLWVMGQKDEATKIFADALKQNPNSALLNSTMNRLNKSPK